MKFYEKRDRSAMKKEERKRVGRVRKMKRKKGEILFRKRNCDGRKRRRERIRDRGKEEMQEKYGREGDRM